MSIDLVWVVLLVLALALVVWRLSALAARIDRLHHRIELAGGSLDNQLVRRARASEALARSGLIDPASAIVLARGASNSRNANPAEPLDRAIVESELTGALTDVLSSPQDVAALHEHPEGRELVEDLAAACNGVAMARRFHNDAVQAARLLRTGPVVRTFRLAGHAPMPTTFEMDDEVPEALAPYA